MSDQNHDPQPTMPAGADDGSLNALEREVEEHLNSAKTAEPTLTAPSKEMAAQAHKLRADAAARILRERKAERERYEQEMAEWKRRKAEKEKAEKEQRLSAEELEADIQAKEEDIDTKEAEDGAPQPFDLSDELAVMQANLEKLRKEQAARRASEAEVELWAQMRIRVDEAEKIAKSARKEAEESAKRLSIAMALAHSAKGTAAELATEEAQKLYAETTRLTQSADEYEKIAADMEARLPKNEVAQKAYDEMLAYEEEQRAIQRGVLNGEILDPEAVPYLTRAQLDEKVRDSDLPLDNHGQIANPHDAWVDDADMIADGPINGVSRMTEEEDASPEMIIRAKETGLPINLLANADNGYRNAEYPWIVKPANWPKIVPFPLPNALMGLEKHPSHPNFSAEDKSRFNLETMHISDLMLQRAAQIYGFVNGQEYMPSNDPKMMRGAGPNVTRLEAWLDRKMRGVRASYAPIVMNPDYARKAAGEHAVAEARKDAERFGDGKPLTDKEVREIRRAAEEQASFAAVGSPDPNEHFGLKWATLLEPDPANANLLAMKKAAQNWGMNTMHTRDGARLVASDAGIMLARGSRETAQAAQVIVMEAKARGWDKITVRGTPEFCSHVRAAMRDHGIGGKVIENHGLLTRTEFIHPAPPAFKTKLDPALEATYAEAREQLGIPNSPEGGSGSSAPAATGAAAAASTAAKRDPEVASEQAADKGEPDADHPEADDPDADDPDADDGVPYDAAAARDGYGRDIPHFDEPERQAAFSTMREQAIEVSMREGKLTREEAEMEVDEGKPRPAAAAPTATGSAGTEVSNNDVPGADEDVRGPGSVAERARAEEEAAIAANALARADGFANESPEVAMAMSNVAQGAAQRARSNAASINPDDVDFFASSGRNAANEAANDAAYSEFASVDEGPVSYPEDSRDWVSAETQIDANPYDDYISNGPR